MQDPVRQVGSARPRRPPPKVTARWMERSAVGYLQRYPATTQRFQQVMRRKITRSLRHHGEDVCSSEEAEALLAGLVVKLQEAGFLDDSKYVRSRVNELYRRGTSERAIQAKLSAKGAPRELVDVALEALREEHGDVALAGAAAYARRRRIGPFRRDPGERPERRQKDLAALARQGFSYGVASKVIDAEDGDELPQPE